MAKEDIIKIEGTVLGALPNNRFSIELSNGSIITARLSGKLQKISIRFLPEDKVTVKLSPYDLTKGAIINLIARNNFFKILKLFNNLYIRFIIMDPVIVSIEGNIGVGKSTLINILKNNFENCEVVNEPVDIWTKITDSSNNKNILELFYDDPEKWSYYFQHVACITRMIKIEEVLKKTNKNIIFLDRSLETDSNIFEKMLYDNKQITEIEHKMYKLLYNFYQDYVRSHSRNIIVYLKSTPETCMKRVQKRNRQGEEKITLEYLENLNKYHDDWLLNNDNKNIIIIDCNEEFENNSIKIQKFINDIKLKIDSL